MATKKYKIGDQYNIPEEGSLGLLAVGYRGVMMWRAKLLKTTYDGALIGPVVQGKEVRVSTVGAKKSNDE